MLHNLLTPLKRTRAYVNFSPVSVLWAEVSILSMPVQGLMITSYPIHRCDIKLDKYRHVIVVEYRIWGITTLPHLDLYPRLRHHITVATRSRHLFADASTLNIWIL